MKRLWISAALILSLALLAGCHVLYLGRLTGELVDLLDQAQEQVLQDDWSQAEALTSQALKLWQRHEFYLHSTMRHNDIDTVLVAFHEVLANLCAGYFPFHLILQRLFNLFRYFLQCGHRN